MSAENVTTYGNVADRQTSKIWKQGYIFEDHRAHRRSQDMEM